MARLLSKRASAQAQTPTPTPVVDVVPYVADGMWLAYSPTGCPYCTRSHLPIVGFDWEGHEQPAVGQVITGQGRCDRRPYDMRVVGLVNEEGRRCA